MLLQLVGSIMLVFGGTLPCDASSSVGSHLDGKVKAGGVKAMGSLSEDEEGGRGASAYAGDDLHSKGDSPAKEALRRLNQQQVRLTKELERTRRRMKEEVTRVKTKQKKTRSKRRREYLGSLDSEGDDSLGPSSAVVDEFTSSLGISLGGALKEKRQPGKGSSRVEGRGPGPGPGPSHRRASSLHTLPVLTSDGRGAFEVGAGMTAGGKGGKMTPQVGVIPVFALPTVAPQTNFINRIPRDPRPEELEARKREREEMLRMQDHLGLSEADLRDLEEEIGAAGRGRSSVNEVDKFLLRQLESGFEVDGGDLASERLDAEGSAAAPHLRLNLGGTGATLSDNVRESPAKYRRTNDAADMGSVLNRSTPRCLGLGVESTTGELREELGSSIHSMQALTAAVKEDVMSIQKMCKIGPQHGRAGVYMKNWAVERVAAILQDVLFSYVGSAFERWTGVVKAMKKSEKMTKYLRYQGTRKMELFLSGWLRKRITEAWVLWAENVAEMRRVERVKLENRMALVLQNAWRGRLSRLMVKKMRDGRRRREEYVGSVKIQAMARGVATRVNYNKILLERARQHASIIIQCALRCYRARVDADARMERRDRDDAGRTLQRCVRGMIGRIIARGKRMERKRNEAAVEIQRCLRGRWGRKRSEKRQTDLIEGSACTIIQKHMRRCLAIRRCKRIREERERERKRLEKAAIVVQKHYRGHRARVMTSMRMKSQRGVVRKRNAAAVKIQSWNRGVEARIRVKSMLQDKMDYMMADSRAWQETWSEESNSWFYYNAETDQAVWEPPSSGYCKADGKLVLATGKVIEDPLKAMTEEEKEAKEKETKCSDCEKAEATRFCNECGDKYCTACYNQAHASGARAEHTFERIGPIECEECQSVLAVKWCVQCDDPFCEECYEKIHSRGKRRLHACCNIDSHGNVSPRAWGRDGQPAGVFRGGKLQGGGSLNMGEDYGETAYGGEYGGGEGFGRVESGEEWSIYETEDGTPYWYSNVTGESTFEDPTGKPVDSGGPAQAVVSAEGGANSVSDAPSMSEGTQQQNKSWLTNEIEKEEEDYEETAASATNNVEGGGNLPQGWATYTDDDGTTYYYNDRTGESTYNFPVSSDSAEMEADPTQLQQNPWEAFYDEDGVEYYYNNQTGVSTYDKP